MAKAIFSVSPSFSSIVAPPTARTLVLQRRAMPRVKKLLLCSSTKGNATAYDTYSTVDYSSISSVFPAEACETIGGEACDVEMYPETKLNPGDNQSKAAKATSELVDREYLEYNNPNTVFIEEACDDLGGEFCKPDHQ